MSRIRTIKPDFWADEKVGKLPIPCRLFFIGCWNFADDFGCIKGNAALLKSQIFPYDDCLRVSEIKKWIDALVDARMLIPIIHNEESYYYIRTFRSHQVLDKRYDKSYIGKGIVKELIDKALQEHNVNTTSLHSEHDVITTQEKEKEVISLSPNVDSDMVDVDDIPLIDLKGGIVKGGHWRESYDEYLSGLRQVFRHLVSDEIFISEQERYYPGMNVRLTLEKACKTYWATDAGWKNKRQKHSNTINWKRTLTNALSQPQNKVYEQKGGKDKRTDDSQYRADILRRLGTAATGGNRA